MNVAPGPEQRPGLASWSWASKGTLVGAFSIHLVLFAGALIRGMTVGTGGDPGEVLPWNTEDVVASGWEGGVNNVNQLFLLYVFSMGVTPVIFSILGAAAGFAIGSSYATWTKKGKATSPTSVHLSSIRMALVYSAAAYLIEMVTRAIVFGSLGLLGWAGSFSLLWLLEILTAIVWLTSLVASYLRFQRWQVSVGVLVIGVSLVLLRFNYIGPPPGLMLGSLLLLLYAAATKGRTSDAVSETSSSMNGVEPAIPSKTSVGASGLAVFLFGGFSFYAVACLLTLFAVMNNHNRDNWGVFVPIVIGAWGIPILGPLAAISHALTGPWIWLSRRRAWRGAIYAMLLCILIWGLIIMTA